MVDLPFDKEHRLTSTFDKPGSLGLAYATDMDGKVFITKIMPGSQASKLLQLQKCARSCASTSAALTPPLPAGPRRATLFARSDGRASMGTAMSAPWPR